MVTIRQVVRNAFVSTSQCSFPTSSFWCHIAFLKLICVLFWIAFQNTSQVTGRKENMNASCPRVNNTHIQRMLGNLGVVTIFCECLSCLKKPIFCPVEIAGCGMKPSHYLTLIPGSIAALCIPEPFIRTQVLVFPVLEMWFSPYKKEPESVGNGRGIHLLSLCVHINNINNKTLHK